MITKDRLHALKQQNLSELHRLLQNTENSRELLFILENLGHLPTNFDNHVILPLTHHTNDKIRLWAVKTLGKMADATVIPRLLEISRTDHDSMVRREAVSSIGRMRLIVAQPFLMELLSDPDPKVVLQAIRGLLVFKENPAIRQMLMQLAAHPNEIIRQVIRMAFSQPALKDGNTPHGSDAPDLHPESPDFMKDVVVQGDVREIINYIPAASIHLTFTSPPYYNARDYSIYASYAAYLDFLDDVFQQVHRITKEGRFLIVNTSPIIIPRVSRAHASKRYPIPFDLHTRLIQQGWEFMDDIIWLKPESSVKNRNAGFLQHRKPLAYKPNAVTEYLMVYRKETDHLLDWNMRQYTDDVIEQSLIQGHYETSNVWKIDPTCDHIHSAVFPLELCTRVIQFYSYQGDLIFDPFGGSGTVGKAARYLGRYFFLTEQEEKYVERMKVDLGNRTPIGERETQFLNLSEFIAISESHANTDTN